MPTIKQEGDYYAGTYGFPLTINLQLKEPLPDDLEEVYLLITRPDSSFFERDLDLPITSGVIVYIFEDGDLTQGGNYQILLKLIFTSGGNLPLIGSFRVLSNPLA
jgi:hypothetical protein